MAKDAPEDNREPSPNEAIMAAFCEQFTPALNYCRTDRIDGVRDLTEIAAVAYARAGVPDRFKAIIFPAGHSLPQGVKAEAYAFLDRWLTE